MSTEGIKFVTEMKKEQESIFARRLIELSHMVDNGIVNSTGAKKVYHVMHGEHLEMLTAIEMLGDMIE